MPRPRKDVEAGLERKGFRRVETHHHRFIYYTLSGKKSGIGTRTSHGSREITDNLLAQMARQCGVTKADFLDLVDCPLDRQGFEEKVQDKL